MTSCCWSAAVSWHCCLAVYQQLFHDITADKQQDTNVMKQLLINSKTTMSWHSCWSTARCHETTADKQQDTNVMMTSCCWSAAVSWHCCLAVYQQLFHDICVLLFISSCFMTLVSCCLSTVVSWHWCLDVYWQLFHDIGVFLFIGSCFMTLVSCCLSTVVSWHWLLAIYQQLFWAKH
jgi:hypothetical protein